MRVQPPPFLLFFALTAVGSLPAQDVTVAAPLGAAPTAQGFAKISCSLPDNPTRNSGPVTSTAPAPTGILLRTTVEVHATSDRFTTEQDSPPPFHARAEEILSSAGTYRDFSRYLQTMPGVVFNNDFSDDIIVRGGNPIENLFVVDGIEIPNINHIASEETTGGLVSMIDTPAIDSVDFYTGGYDARYDERLSSVVDIHTRTDGDRQSHTEADLGFIGLGGVTIFPLGRKGSLLTSAHRSLLNFVSDDIGLGGTPVYSNVLLRAHLNPTTRDELTLLSLSGFDSIDITPGGPGLDSAETSTINMQYSGWRSTNGMRWHHGYSRRLFGILTASDSEQQEDIAQENQFYEILHTKVRAHTPVPVYSQLSHDGRANLKYELAFDSGNRWSAIAGTSGYLNRIDYQIAQPLGEQSPLSINPANSDADSFAPNFLSGETGSYAEATFRPNQRWSVSGGGRLQTFALGGHVTATPRLSSALRLSEHTGLHAAFGEYAQMPPAIDVTSWPHNYHLLPIRVRHIIAGADLYSGRNARVGIEVYQKNYRDYPVSTEYPSLSMANMIDTLGQEFFWLPLTSHGSGLARGAELSTTAHLGPHFSTQANVAYSRTRFSGLDGVLRPGNFDWPLVINSSGAYRSGKHYEASWRYQYTTGHPYTPYLLDASAAQNRPIYDLSQVNALRGPVYSRFDFETDRTFFIGSRRLVLYSGLDNVWNRKNFLGYFWMPRVDAYWGCGKDGQKCLSEQYDMVRFPDFGVRFLF